MPIRARLVIPGDGVAVTRSPRPARPDRNVAASTRIGPGRCHNVMVRAWRLRDHRGKWAWRERPGGCGRALDHIQTRDTPQAHLTFERLPRAPDRPRSPDPPRSPGPGRPPKPRPRLPAAPAGAAPAPRDSGQPGPAPRPRPHPAEMSDPRATFEQTSKATWTSQRIYVRIEAQAPAGWGERKRLTWPA